MRVVFLGTPEFGVPSLQALVEAGYEVAGVFTQPDKPRGRGNKLAPSPVKECALGYGIPIFQPRKIRLEGVEDAAFAAPRSVRNGGLRPDSLSRNSGYSAGWAR